MGDAEATERLHRYWVHGPGAAKIEWGSPGDFERCVHHLGKYIGNPQGYCDLAHHAATGMWPAQHAEMIKKGTGRSEVTVTAERADNKPYGNVTYADPKNGKYPVDTHDHAKAAWSYINMPKNAAQYPMNGVTLSEVKGRIKAACKKFGIDVSDDDSSSRADSLLPFTRSVPFEDISVRGSDGRVVEAYATVFNTPAEVRDDDGHYMEVIDPVAFNRAISDAAPQGSRKGWKIGVFYNHGRTIVGTPSDRYSMPCGKILDIKADDRGLWTEIRYHRSAVGEEVLENIREGAPGGYSFSGRFLRSQPHIPRGGFKQNYRTGELTTVRRTESTLKELGWTPFPVYEKAEVLGMRAQLLDAMAADPELTMRMLSMFRDSAPQDSLPLPGAPGTGLATEDSPPLVRARSGRSVKEQIDAARADFLLRYRR